MMKKKNEIKSTILSKTSRLQKIIEIRLLEEISCHSSLRVNMTEIFFVNVCQKNVRTIKIKIYSELL